MALASTRPDSRVLALPDEAATARLARAIAEKSRAGDILALFGDLGAGKTVFARAFINALERPQASGDSAEDVPSPTFTLVQVYERRPAPVWHFDLYRLENPEEAIELGFEEALGEAIVLIEWPERLAGFLPPERLDVHLTFAGHGGRVASLEPADGGWAERLQELDFDG